MAKIMIIFTDHKTGGFELDIKFDPPVNTEKKMKLTNAQKIGWQFGQQLMKHFREQQED